MGRIRRFLPSPRHGRGGDRARDVAERRRRRARHHRQEHQERLGDEQGRAQPLADRDLTCARTASAAARSTRPPSAVPSAFTAGGATRFAVVNAGGKPCGATISSAARTSEGRYQVIFNGDVRNCALRRYRRRRRRLGAATNTQISVGSLASNVNVAVRTENGTNGTELDRPFHTVVMCWPIRVVDRPQHPRGDPRRHREGGDVPRDDAVGADHAALADGHAAGDDDVGAAPDVVLDVGPLLVKPCHGTGGSGSSKRCAPSVMKQPLANMQWSPISTSSTEATITPMFR